jgi:hypothetical protein
LDFNLKGLSHELSARQRPTEDIEDARHRSMMEAIAPYAKKTQQKNMTPVYVDYKTRNTKLVLVLCPEWAPMFPPFNLARLSGVAKTAGYETSIMDLNVRAYNQYRNDWQPNKKIPFKLWDPSASWHWLGDTYLNDIHPVLEPLLMAACDELEALNPDVIGFSVYYISEEPTKWMCQELKRRMPHIKIMVGGSNVQKSWFHIQSYYDYVVNGEGEEVILKILDEIENGITHDSPQYLVQPEDQRININGLPMPDYESIDFSVYEVPNGVNTEISRGCTAKCTFCEETHFWKYRQRQAVDLITELEWLYYNKGTDILWFIDSLVNGNLNELRAFCKGVVAKDLKINWTGYARCDGRMDLEYFKDLKASGCIMLNYGIESGSQKVLDDMDKGVTIAEMEQNLRDGKATGVFAATNWIVGFPTEELQDFADSISFLWRMRNMNINNVGAGVGYGLGPETIIGQNPHKFNISWHKYQNHWITNDFRKGGTHVMCRVKFFHMFIDFMKGCTDVPVAYPVRDALARDHYEIKLNYPSSFKEIEYEKFDYNIIKVRINPFADSLVNEIWPFLRMLWRCRGGFSAEIVFCPELDLKEFGSQFGPGMFNANYKFVIDEEGKWEADFHFKFEQVENPYDDRAGGAGSRKGAFYAQDYSRMQSNTAARARNLAKPTWDLKEGRSGNDFSILLAEEVMLNKTVDFSFAYHYEGTGHWGNHEEYAIEVPSVSVPVEKWTPLQRSIPPIPLGSIKRMVK